MTFATKLSGRRVVVTGAGRGLGRAFSIVAADLGADLVLLGRSIDALKSVSTIIQQRTGRAAEAFACDLARPDSIAEACQAVTAKNPVIDVLINNGAPWLPGNITQHSDAEIESTIAAAVTGTILVTKQLLPALKQSTAADIVTIVSTAGWTGWDINGASAAFHAAKHGQSGFSDRLRHEVKSEGIRVTAIYPPDFDDFDPLQPEWNDLTQSVSPGKLTNREVVSTMLFAISAPRTCSYPVIMLDNMR